MSKILSLLALTVAVAALGPAALAQSDPAADVKADAAKVLVGSKAAHDTLIVDAHAVTDAAQAAKGGTRAQARATVRPALQQLRTDRRALAAQLKADRLQLKADLNAAREAKAAKGLRPLLRSMRTTLRQQHVEVRQAVQAARQAVRELRASFAQR